MLTIRMSEQEHRALKLYAVLQGRSVNAVVTDLIRAELTRQAWSSSASTTHGAGPSASPTSYCGPPTPSPPDSTRQRPFIISAVAYTAVCLWNPGPRHDR